jgi:DNA (cytosine-5)-methyltransferase 1
MTLWLVRHNPKGLCPDEKRLDLSANPSPTIMAGGVWGDNLSHCWLEDDGVKIVRRGGDETWESEMNLDGRPCPSVTASGVYGVARSRYEIVGGAENMNEQPDGKPLYRVPSMPEIEAVPWNGLTAVSTFTGCGGSCLGLRMAGFEALWASEFIPAAAEVYRLNHPGVHLDTRDIRKVTPEEILEITGKKKGEIDLVEGSPPCASFSTAGKRDKSWGQVVKYSETKQRVDDLFFEFARIVEGLQPRVFVAENVSGLVKGKAKGYFREILARLKDCGYKVKAKLLDAQWLGVPQARQRIIFVGVRNDLDMLPVHPRPLAYRYSVAEAIPWIVSQGDNAGFGGGAMREASEPSGSLGASPQTGNGRFPPSVVEVRAVEDTGGDWGMGDVTDRPAPTVRQAGVGHLLIETGSIDPETGDDLDISRFAIGKEWDRLEQGEKGRYFNLVKPAVDKPSPTVCQATSQAFNPMACASVVHPVERRKFTIGELKRICAFPDDFALTGSYAQRWERLGRAVPPVMMFHIGRVVRDALLELDGKEPWDHDPPCLVAGLNWEPERRWH